MTEAYETEVLGVLANISAGTDRVRSDQYGYDVIRVMVNFGTEARLTINGVEYNLHFVTAEVRIHEDGTTVIGYVSTQGMRRSNWNGDVTHAASDKVRTAVKDLIELLIASGRIELLESDFYAPGDPSIECVPGDRRLEDESSGTDGTSP